VYTGKQTIDWLFFEQLKVDNEWALQTDNGFRWWADRNAQTVEVTGQEMGPDGKTGFLTSVRTEMLQSFDLDNSALGKL